MKGPLWVFSLVLLLSFIFACHDNAAMAEFAGFKAQAKLEDQNRGVVIRFFEEYNKGNIEIFNELCAPDYFFYSPSNNPKPMSREEQIDVEKIARKAFPDLHLSIDELYAVGDSAIVRGIGTGTHQGEFQGIRATGNAIAYGNIIIMRLKDGKIVETRVEADVLGLMQQLGMELRPKEVRK